MKRVILLTLLLCLLLLSACAPEQGAGTPGPSPTPAVQSTVPPDDTPVVTPTPEAAPTPEATPTPKRRWTYDSLPAPTFTITDPPESVKEIYGEDYELCHIEEMGATFLLPKSWEGNYILEGFFAWENPSGWGFSFSQKDYFAGEWVELEDGSVGRVPTGWCVNLVQFEVLEEDYWEAMKDSIAPRPWLGSRDGYEYFFYFETDFSTMGGTEETYQLYQQMTHDIDSYPLDASDYLIFDDTQDHVLLTREAPLADGRVLSLEVIGKRTGRGFGAREVRVYEEGELLQTLYTAEAVARDSGDRTDSFKTAVEYTNCWTAEDTLEVLDLNFDGNADVGLFGDIPNNTIPYHYWTWDTVEMRYRYACTLQGVSLDPEAEEVSSEYKHGREGAAYTTDYYSPDEDGNLHLVRQANIVGGYSQDSSRFAVEIWVPRDGIEIPPRPFAPQEPDLVLFRREVPVLEFHDDHSVSRFTEIWEQKDGVLQLVCWEPWLG